MATKSEIVTQLQAHVNGAVAARGLRLGEGAVFDVGRLIDRAAAEIAAFAPDVQSRRLGEAHAAFATLIEKMAEAREVIPGYKQQRGDVIGEDTFKWARDRICPLWPVCD
jgi:hypothetical protein